MKTNLIAILLILGLVAALAMGQDGPPPVDPPVEPLPSDAQTEQAERDLRDDHYDAKRAAARDADDDLLAQQYVAMERGAAMLVSMRESFKKYRQRIEQLEANQVPPHVVYDGANGPGLPLEGTQRLRFFYRGGIWAGGQDDAELPDEAQFKAFIQNKPGDHLVIDIEHWPLDIRQSTEAEVAASIAKLITIIGWAKEAQPEATVGIYSMVPIRNYWTPQNHEPWSEAYRKWADANGRLAELAAVVDVIYPSIYTFYEDRDGWVKYATANMLQARQYGKPVIPLLWPRYHDSNPTLNGQPIPGDFWRLQLETLGTVGIWDAIDDYDTNPDWLIETRNYIESQ